MRRFVSVAGVAALAAFGLGVVPAEAAPGHPDAEVAGVAAAFGLSDGQARAQLAAQDEAHRLAAALPVSVRASSAGQWFDAATGKLTLAVTTTEAAGQARAAGAAARVVARSRADLDRTDAAVRALVGAGVPGVYGWGVDVRGNEVGVDVDRTKKTAATESFLSRVRELGVRVTETATSPRQQSGTIQTGNPWWPGSESNCSVGFPVTDASGAKHFLTAGHCTNDRDQAAYGASGQQNRIGTSNVGGSHSVNAREGDMGVVAVTEAGWTLSASVNTWGQPAVTLTGAAEAMVGDRVCHSGNTSHWQCGEVKYTHKSVDYGGGLVIDDLTWTTACSLGGDSGGGWLLGDKATGLHDGGPSQCVQNPSDGDLSLFQPVIEALSKWQLSLVTGSGPTPGGRTLTNDADYPIRDYQQVFSPVTSTLTGQAATSLSVAVTIRHTCAEDLGVTLLDPKNKAYALKYSGGSTCTPWNGPRTFSVPASSPAAGKWQLRVADYGPGDTGTLDTWSITL
ncbi:proprotein convertase P-domain-containing protein [Amycolatopsis sp. NPDC098790]|uniref:proprotein convertase P-domain-containing protein n=1 Tax=Amycolatopsis sp. NPDC098790 TaxID=3363939 RepID=UPI00381E4AE3